MKTTYIVKRYTDRINLPDTEFVSSEDMFKWIDTTYQNWTKKTLDFKPGFKCYYNERNRILHYIRCYTRKVMDYPVE
jgi:hypothetical protein